MVITIILAIYAALTPFFYWKFLSIGAEMSGEKAPQILPPKPKRRKKRDDTAEEKARNDYAWNVEHYYGAGSAQREITR